MCIVYSSNTVVVDDVTTGLWFCQTQSRADVGWMTRSVAVVPAGARLLTLAGRERARESVNLFDELRPSRATRWAFADTSRLLCSVSASG